MDAVRFDYQEPATFHAALTGTEGVVLIAPPLDSEAAAKLNPFIDKARRTVTRHVVFISAFGVDAFEQAPLRRIERHLMGSGVNYTILRPNFFMENFSTGFLAPMVKQAGIYLAAGDGKTSFISNSDIAETAARAVQTQSFGKEYNLTGPEALDHTKAASILSQVAGKTIAYYPLTEKEMFKGMRDNGLPESAFNPLGFCMAPLESDILRQSPTMSKWSLARSRWRLSLTFEQTSPPGGEQDLKKCCSLKIKWDAVTSLCVSMAARILGCW